MIRDSRWAHELSFGFGVDNQHIYMDEPPFSSSRWKYHGTIGVLYALVMYYVGYFKVEYRGRARHVGRIQNQQSWIPWLAYIYTHINNQTTRWLFSELINPAGASLLWEENIVGWLISPGWNQQANMLNKTTTTTGLKIPSYQRDFVHLLVHSYKCTANHHTWNFHVLSHIARRLTLCMRLHSAPIVTIQDSEALV